MIQSFRDQGTEDVFNGRATRKARSVCPQAVWAVAARKLDLLDSADAIGDLRVPPGNQLEALSGDQKGQFSIRINQQYRICFRWAGAGPADIVIVDYH